MRNFVGFLIGLQVAVTPFGALGISCSIARVAVETLALFNTAEAVGTVVREKEVSSGKANNQAPDDVSEIRSNEGSDMSVSIHPRSE